MPTTRFSDSGLILDGDGEIPLLSGEMHYWRHHRSEWPAALAALKAMGLSIVSTYVPWSVHEGPSGAIRFTGPRDLPAFLDQVERAGLKALVRPGPHINAELTLFGFPRRVIETRAALAVSARDTPVWLPAPPRMFPVPSYASSVFATEVKNWFGAVGEAIADKLFPSGPVVAVQVDNEMQMFFRLGAYDHDYHPDALAWWKQYAGDIEPPRAWDAGDEARCVRWVRFKTEYMTRSLRWLAEALDDAGLGTVAKYHNVPPAAPNLVNLPAMATAIDGVCGMDFYHQARDYESVRHRGLYVVGSSVLPYSPEVGAGGPLWLFPMTESDQRNVLLGLLAAGLRAVNLYMAVERERWYGAPIAADGTCEPEADWLRTLFSTLDGLDWPHLRRPAPVAYMLSRAESDVAIASAALDPLTPVVTELFGIDGLCLDESASLHQSLERSVLRALAIAEAPFVIVDEAADVDLSKFALVVLPTIARADPDLWARLETAAKSGTRVLVGPEQPSIGATLPGGFGLIPMTDTDALADAIAGVLDAVTELQDCWIAPDHPVDCSVFEDQSGAARAVFVGNRTAKHVSADVVVPATAVLRDPFDGSVTTPGTDGIARISVDAHQVRLFVLDP